MSYTSTTCISLCRARTSFTPSSQRCRLKAPTLVMIATLPLPPSSETARAARIRPAARSSTPKQMIRFRRRQRRRRLVEREQAAVERERAGDLEQLAVRNRQRLYRRIGRDRQLEAREEIAGARVHFGLAEPAEAPSDLPPREDVRGGRQVRKREHLLVHEPDAARQRIARARERDWRVT
jgi:hypothetical protein